MVHIGNHLKMTLPNHLRARARQFYEGPLGCQTLASPLANLDLYEFAGGFVLGLFFAPGAETLPEADYTKATWMELKVERPEEQVYRLAPMDGGL